MFLNVKREYANWTKFEAELSIVGSLTETLPKRSRGATTRVNRQDKVRVKTVPELKADTILYIGGDLTRFQSLALISDQDLGPCLPRELRMPQPLQ